MADGKLPEDGEPKICPILILHGTADHHIFISVAPIRRKAFFQPVNSFREKVKQAVAAGTDHFPAFPPPWIRILQKKV